MLDHLEIGTVGDCIGCEQFDAKGLADLVQIAAPARLHVLKLNDDVWVIEEPEACAAIGVAFDYVPIPQFGAVLACEAALRAAVDRYKLARSLGRVVVGHCTAGIDRTGAFFAAVRMLVMAWTFAQANAERLKFGGTFRMDL